MTKISRLQLNDAELQSLHHEFWQALAALRTVKDVEALLAGFLTHTEIKMFAKRLAAAKMLLRDASYAEIRQTLKLTDTPIARINNLLNENKRFKALVAKSIL